MLQSPPSVASQPPHPPQPHHLHHMGHMDPASAMAAAHHQAAALQAAAALHQGRGGGGGGHSPPMQTQLPPPPGAGGGGFGPPPPHHHHPGGHPGLPFGHAAAAGLEQHPPKPRLMFKMPRVVANQKEKFETDDLMKRHAREGEIRYTAFRDRPLQERQAKFLAALREGHTEVAFIGTGFNLVLTFNPLPGFDPRFRQMDFEKEPGRVHLNAPVILNGVCVRWKGHLDLERLDGAATLEFDEEAAKIEDVILREQVEAYNRRMKEFEEYRKAQQRHIAAFMGQHHAMQQAAAAAAAAQHHQVSSRPTAAEASSTSVTASMEPSFSKSNGQIHSAADLVDIEEDSPSSMPLMKTTSVLDDILKDATDDDSDMVDDIGGSKGGKGLLELPTISSS